MAIFELKTLGLLEHVKTDREIERILEGQFSQIHGQRKERHSGTGNNFCSSCPPLFMDSTALP